MTDNVEAYLENVAEPNWRNRGQDVVARPSRNAVSARTKAREDEIAWREDYRVRNGAAITQEAGESLGRISRRFEEMTRDDAGIAPGLAAFEAAYVSAAAHVIARYTAGQ